MKVLIFGSGGLAKELIGYLWESLEYEIVGVVSTEPFNNPAYAIPVFDRAPEADGYFLAVADPGLKRKIVAENDDKWLTYAHPSCVISPFSTVGRGSILAPQAILSGDASIGRFVFLNTNATVGHDTTIGDFSTLFPNSEVCGDCVIGEDCIFGIGSYVLPKVFMPSGSKASAGAVVRKSVFEPTTLYGDPAMPRQYRKDLQ